METGESGFGQRKRKNIKTVELSKNSSNREIFQVDRIMRERKRISNEGSKKKTILREIVSFGQSDSAQNFDGHVKKTSFYSIKYVRERTLGKEHRAGSCEESENLQTGIPQN